MVRKVRKRETDTHTDHHGEEEGDRHTAQAITMRKVRKRETDTQH